MPFPTKFFKLNNKIKMLVKQCRILTKPQYLSCNSTNKRLVSMPWQQHTNLHNILLDIVKAIKREHIKSCLSLCKRSATMVWSYFHNQCHECCVSHHIWLHSCCVHFCLNLEMRKIYNEKALICMLFGFNYS